MKDWTEKVKVNEVHEVKRCWEVNGKNEINGKAVSTGHPQGRQEARGKPMADGKGLPVYTWEEIQKHNLKTDQWLVINRKVYDVTKWADRHPGGSRVLNHYAGEDATDVILAMHLDQNVVQKYLKHLLIGELAPEEPSQETNKNTQLVEDFRALRKTVEDQKLLEPSLPYFFMHLIQILFLEVLVWFILRNFGNGWLITLLVSFILAVSQAQAFFLQHDTGHHFIFKKSKWNHLMHDFVIGHLKGMSAKWWNYRHFQHHAKPNIYPKDPDIDMGPFVVLGESQPVKYEKKKIKYIDYKKQHLYFYVVALPLLMSVFINMKSLKMTFLRKEWGSLPGSVAFIFAISSPTDLTMELLGLYFSYIWSSCWKAPGLH
ncbi:fatty acid desaturase 2-like protein FADS2B [Notamacropus eugenii]|uniref:fatty acid desaturase 2-like protein FADS2B n=1 Tax=Notamacropus eugenii TaxID=9315 RepID=UPI003B67D5DD